jgi:hypothetical protein
VERACQLAVFFLLSSFILMVFPPLLFRTYSLIMKKLCFVTGCLFIDSEEQL